MDGLRWSRVLLQWINDSKLIGCEHDDIEQCNVEDFYQQFRKRMEPTLAVPETSVIKFLEVHFPHYELYPSETGQIAKPDHFYIFSLLLYFSCVRHPERFFQQICNGFDKPKQCAVAAFFKAIINGTHLQKNIDRTMLTRAIEEAMPQTMLPPKMSPTQQLAKSASQQSVPSRMLSSSDVLDSPVRNNSRLPKISPPTPKTLILDERTRQLKELKAQLEAERYEKGYLEMQLKQLQEKNEKILEEKRKHTKEIRELKIELLSCNRENESPNKQRGTEHKLARIERQLAEKEGLLEQLRTELETVQENNRNATEMITYRNDQINKLKDEIAELHSCNTNLCEHIKENEAIITCLRDECENLQTFIRENRLKREGEGVDTLNTSFECLELSYQAASAEGTEATGKPSEITLENLARSVVDVQLKEKEAENCLLKRSLEMIQQEKVRVSSLVEQFFRMYGEGVGKLPQDAGNPIEVGFVEKMNIFRVCYETLFDKYGQCKQEKQTLEQKNDELEENIRQIASKEQAVSGVLRSTELELVSAKKCTAEYEQHIAEIEQESMQQKQKYLMLISDKDDLQKKSEALCQQNEELKGKYSKLEKDYDSINRKIDHLMATMNEDYEATDFSTWLEKIDEMAKQFQLMKESKEQLTGSNMKITMKKVELEKEVENGRNSYALLQEQHSASKEEISDLHKQLQQQVSASLDQQNHMSQEMEKIKVDLNAKIESLSSELFHSESQLQTTQESLRSQEETYGALKDELQKCIAQLDESNSSSRQLQSDLEKRQQLLTKLEQEALTDKQRLDELEEKLRDTTLQLDESRRKFDELTNEHRQLIEQKDSLKQVAWERDELEIKYSSIQMELSAAKELNSHTSQESQAKIDSLTNELTSAQMKLCQVEKEKTQLESELADGLENLAQQNVTVSRLCQEKELLEKKIQNLTTALSSIKENNSSLKEALDRERENCSSGALEVETMSEQIKELKESIALLEEDIYVLREEKCHLEAENERIDHDKESLESQCTRLLAELAKERELATTQKLQHEQTLAEADEKKRSLERIIEALETDLTTCNELLEKTKQDLCDKVSNTDKLKDRMAQIAEELNAAQVKLEETKESNQATIESLELAQKQQTQTIESLKDNVNTAQKNLHEETLSRENLSQQLANVQLERAILDSQLADAKTQLSNANSEQQQLQLTIKQKDSEMKHLSEELTAFKSLLAQLESKIAAFEAIVSEKDELQAQLQKHLDEETRSRENVSKQLEQTQLERASLESQLSDTNRCLTLATSEQLELQSAIQQKESEIRQLTEELTHVKSSQTPLESQLSDANQRLAQSKSEQQELEAVVEKKNSEINRLTDELNNLKARLEGKLAECDALVAENHDLERQTIKLHEEKAKLSTDLNKINEEKADVDSRLIKQLEVYDALNEAFLTERDHKQALADKEQQLIDDIDRLKAARDDAVAQLATKQLSLQEQEKLNERLKQEMEKLSESQHQQVESLAQELKAQNVHKTELLAQIERLEQTIEQKSNQEKVLQESVAQLRESLRIKQEEIESTNSRVIELQERLHASQIESNNLLSIKDLQANQLLDLQLKTSEQSKTIEQLQQSLRKTESSHLEDNSKVNKLLKEIDKFKIFEKKFYELEAQHKQMIKGMEQNEEKFDILRQKLTRSRKMADEKEQAWSQERQKLRKEYDDGVAEKIRELREDYDRQLAKANHQAEKIQEEKSKMFQQSTQLHEELNKEREKCEQLMIIRAKLQQQISNLNEKNLGLMKDIELANSKNRIMNEIQQERKFKPMPPPSSKASLCANLKMEDEEGEIFNTTYLADMKAGRMSSAFAGRESVRLSELMDRNSKQPPHLRSSYVAQYTDMEFSDDDNKETHFGPLDDSSTSLISRKKASGITSYKRPGPPTPSKKAGRLSIGGALPTNDFQYKEILQDNTNNGAAASGVTSLANRLSFGSRKSTADLADLNSRRKTPSKFMQMWSSSSSNMLNTLQKDETQQQPTPQCHQTVTRIQRPDDSDSGGSGLRSRAHSKTGGPGGGKKSRFMRARTNAYMQKMAARFDKNRRLSSADSDSAGSSPRNSGGDPYGGFSYEGTPDTIKKIDVNTMNVFSRSERNVSNVMIFRGEPFKLDDNNNLVENEPKKKPPEMSSQHFGPNDFVQLLWDSRRERLRRKSCDQRRALFNIKRNIDGEVFRSTDPVESSPKAQFEDLLREKVLDRPSEILPSQRNRFGGGGAALEPFDDMVTSSSGLRTISAVPLLERFSEIFRIAKLQREKYQGGPSHGEPATRQQPLQMTYMLLVAFVGLSFAALLCGMYLALRSENKL